MCFMGSHLGGVLAPTFGPALGTTCQVSMWAFLKQSICSSSISFQSCVLYLDFSAQD